MYDFILCRAINFTWILYFIFQKFYSPSHCVRACAKYDTAKYARNAPPPDMENSFLNWEGNFMRKWSCSFYLPCNFVWLELPINFWWTDFIMMWWALIDWFWQAQIGIDLRCVAYRFGTWKISWFHEWMFLLTCLYNTFDIMENS